MDTRSEGKWDARDEEEQRFRGVRRMEELLYSGTGKMMTISGISV